MSTLLETALERVVALPKVIRIIGVVAMKPTAINATGTIGTRR
jgi:hypothetical protein